MSGGLNTADRDARADDAALDAARAARLFEPLRDEAVLLVAVSGGGDSMALLGLLIEWARHTAGAPTLFAATVDHGLRPGSANEAALVAAFCMALGIPHSSLAWEGLKPVTGVQARAREGRYTLLAREARRRGATALVTAHTRDDQAETVLMRLCAGSGPAGLAGMAARGAMADGLPLLRPLLAVSRASLRATCAARGWPFVDDPSNSDRRFARVRFRALIASLAGEGLTPARIATLSRRWQESEAALAPLVEDLARRATHPHGIDLRPLREAPAATRVRALARLIDDAAARHASVRAPLRLHRLEALAGRLFESAAPPPLAFRGLVLRVGADDILRLTAAPERRRGVAKPLPSQR